MGRNKRAVRETWNEFALVPEFKEKLHQQAFQIEHRYNLNGNSLHDDMVQEMLLHAGTLIIPDNIEDQAGFIMRCCRNRALNWLRKELFVSHRVGFRKWIREMKAQPLTDELLKELSDSQLLFTNPALAADIRSGCWLSDEPTLNRPDENKIRYALQRCKGVVTHCARFLGVPERSLRRWMAGLALKSYLTKVRSEAA